MMKRTLPIVLTCVFLLDLLSTVVLAPEVDSGACALTTRNTALGTAAA